MFKVLVIVKKKQSRHDRSVLAELILLFRAGLSKKTKTKKTTKLYGSFLWMGFNCLKARATSRRQFSFYHGNELEKYASIFANID